jgi:hypothetical protein
MSTARRRATRGIAAAVASIIAAACGSTRTVTVHAPAAQTAGKTPATATSTAAAASLPPRPLDVTAICGQMRQNGESLNSGTVTIGRNHKVTGCAPSVDDSTSFSYSSPNPASLYMLPGWRAWKVWVADDQRNTGVVTCTFRPDVGSEVALHVAAGSKAITTVDLSRAHNHVTVECSSDGGGDAIALGGQILSSGS